MKSPFRKWQHLHWTGETQNNEPTMEDDLRFHFFPAQEAVVLKTFRNLTKIACKMHSKPDCGRKHPADRERWVINETLSPLQKKLL